MNLVHQFKRVLKTGFFGALCGLTWAAAGEGLRFTAVSVTSTAPFPPAAGAGYAISNLVAGGGPETRLYLHGHHFASVLTASGIFAVRPHPGVDRNGWGSTLYLQPFIAGAVLGHSAVSSCVATPTGVLVNVSGYVSKSTSGTYGTWRLTDLIIAYSPEAKRLTAASGSYAITLSGPVVGAGGDLNLFKLASNYLDDVPRLDGTAGDTGDMCRADYTTDQGTSTWTPSVGPDGHFSGPATGFLSITAVGTFNDIDTLAQSWTNFRAIQAAYKPSLRVDLTAQDAGYGMIPGFIYTSAASKLYYSDNVGITPVIGSGVSATGFAYSVSLDSWPPEGDGTGVDVRMAAAHDGGTDWPSVEAYFTEDLADTRTNRFVGVLELSAPGLYEGFREVPRAPWSDGHCGFFRLTAPAR
ncbi:MAG: hypothetical protein WCK89_08065 [bacterium]